MQLEVSDDKVKTYERKFWASVLRYCPPPCIRHFERCSSRESCSRGWCDA